MYIYIDIHNYIHMIYTCLACPICLIGCTNLAQEVKAALPSGPSGARPSMAPNMAMAKAKVVPPKGPWETVDVESSDWETQRWKTQRLGQLVFPFGPVFDASWDRKCGGVFL